MTRGGRHGDAGLTIGREGLKPVSEFLDHAKGEKKPFLLWYAPLPAPHPARPTQTSVRKIHPARPRRRCRQIFRDVRVVRRNLRRTVRRLDRCGLSENTLVIYLCVNGWAATSANAADPKKKAMARLRPAHEKLALRNGHPHAHHAFMVRPPQSLMLVGARPCHRYLSHHRSGGGDRGTKGFARHQPDG